MSSLIIRRQLSLSYCGHLKTAELYEKFTLGLLLLLLLFSVGDRREVISTVRIQAPGAHGTHIPRKITFNFASLGHQICLI